MGGALAGRAGALPQAGAPLGVTLGPGLLGRIFDGLLRPLAATGAAQAFAFTPAVSRGDRVGPGQVFGQSRSGDARPQACLVPPEVSGEAIEVEARDEVADSVRLKGREDQRITIGMRAASKVRVSTSDTNSRG